MRDLNKVSKKKNKLIEEYKKKNYFVGEYITINESDLKTYGNRDVRCVVTKVNPKSVRVTIYDYGDNEYLVDKSKIKSRWLGDVGANPFPSEFNRIRSVNFTLESLVFTFELLFERKREYFIDNVPIKELNWNPLIIGSDNKPKYYQRDYVWTLENKQLLIESIYNSINCGTILVRKRSFRELENLKRNYDISELGFYDIVDGKQRLNCIREFLNDEFSDMNGNYYSDLSNMSQHKLLNHQLFQYSEIDENSDDIDIIKQFLKLNFSGIPQSKEHLEYVRSLI